MKDWIYDEFKQVGVDYTADENVDIYDEQMESFRDYEQETKKIIERLNVPDTKLLTTVDIGCGTGAFVISAAKYFKKVYAVDISEEMLKISSSKAKSRGITNIEFCHSGFLHFQPDEKTDLVHSKWAFHHLPDFWKQSALFNINKMLKPGGVFILTDVVFKSDPDYVNTIEKLLFNLSEKFDADFINETKIHIKDEFSTFDWIIRGMIERAGFTVENSDTKDLLASEYWCRK